QSVASLYRGLACRGADSQSQAQAGEAPACRRRAESSQTAARLPVPHPLRLCAGVLPPGDPAIARSRTGALGFMSFSLMMATLSTRPPPAPGIPAPINSKQKRRLNPPGAKEPGAAGGAGETARALASLPPRPRRSRHETVGRGRGPQLGAARERL